MSTVVLKQAFQRAGEIDFLFHIYKVFSIYHTKIILIVTLYTANITIHIVNWLYLTANSSTPQISILTG